MSRGGVAISPLFVQAAALPVRRTVLGRHQDLYVSRADMPAEAAARRPVPRQQLLACDLGYSPWGVSPLAAGSLREFDVAALARYPAEHSYETLLMPAIAERYGFDLAEKHLFLAHGSLNLLERVVHKLLEPGPMLGIGPQFPYVSGEWAFAGGSYRALPLEGPQAALPLPAIEQALRRERVAVVYLDNPNNPLGRHFPLTEVERLADACERASTVLLVDEAYGDFVDDSQSAIGLVASHSNLIVTRSFSKALGLGAERIGYGFLSSPLAECYRELDGPYEPGIVAATLARETLRDAGFLEWVRCESAWAKAEIVQALEHAGIDVLATHPCVSILAAHAPGRRLSAELHSLGVEVLSGASFAGTHADWDDSYCRLRVVRRELVPLLCERIRGLA